MEVKEKRRRLITMSELQATKFRCMEFEGQWERLFGKPEISGCWIVWGESANGKTSFMLQLCKYLTNFGRIAYNSIEEGLSESLKAACMREGMNEVERGFYLLDKEPILQLENRLKARKSPDIIVIDSVQYTELNKITAKQLVDRHPRKLFIFVSHASGKLPDGRTANAIRFNANVKIRVEGFRAKVLSRYGGDKTAHYTIYPEGASMYWDETI